MAQQQQGELLEVLARAAQGDQEAWNAVVEQYRGLLWSVVRGFRLGDDLSRDVVQMTWLRLVEHLGDIRDLERLPAWLAMTARRCSIDAIRQSRRTRPLDDEPELPSGDESPEGAVLRFERESLVRQALSRLSERDQALLRMLAGSVPVTYEEISVRMAMPVGSIGPTRMRALARLRTELELIGLSEPA
jgi:RNA polymerase sigma factor (sigma-70 family)